MNFFVHLSIIHNPHVSVNLIQYFPCFGTQFHIISAIQFVLLDYLDLVYIDFCLVHYLNYLVFGLLRDIYGLELSLF